jgi:hypothetical protein
MKPTKIIYWISTGIICLFSLGAIQMNSQMAIGGANHLLIPRYLGIEVSIGQLISLNLKQQSPSFAKISQPAINYAEVPIAIIISHYYSNQQRSKKRKKRRILYFLGI